MIPNYILNRQQGGALQKFKGLIYAYGRSDQAFD